MTGRGAIGLTLSLCVWAGWANAWSAPAPAGEVTAIKVSAGPAHAAESGAVDTAATSGPLAIGAMVRDGGGALIGHFTLLTTDKDGRSIVQVREGVNVYAIPIADLSARGGQVISSIRASDLKPDADGRSH